MSNATVDLRGFIYPLTALLDKHGWELERLQAQTATAKAKLMQMQQQLKEVAENCSAQHAYLAESVQTRPDPVMHRRALDYLVRARGVVVALEKDVEDAGLEHRKLLDRCIGMHRKIQMLEEHRAEQLQEYVATEQTRLASELDREWSARSLWTTRVQPVSDVVAGGLPT